MTQLTLSHRLEQTYAGRSNYFSTPRPNCHRQAEREI
jgi:hypothetical protein